MYQVLELMEKGIGVSRSDYLAMMRRHPNEKFNVGPNELQPYPTMVKSDEIIMDLTEKIEMESLVLENNDILFTDEHFKLVHSVMDKLKALKNSVAPYISVIEDTDEPFLITKMDKDTLELKNISNLPFIQSLSYVDDYMKKSFAPSDTSRYIATLKDSKDLSLEFFTLITHRRKVTMGDIVEVCRDGSFNLFIDKLIGIVGSEMTASDLVDYKTKKIESIIANDTITIVKLAKTLVAM